MSKYSGRCDFYDTIQLYGYDTIKNYKIFVDGKKVPLTISNISDLEPYYGYIISVGAFDGIMGTGTIYLVNNEKSC